VCRICFGAVSDVVSLYWLSYPGSREGLLPANTQQFLFLSFRFPYSLPTQRSITTCRRGIRIPLSGLWYNRVCVSLFVCARACACVCVCAHSDTPWTSSRIFGKLSTKVVLLSLQFAVCRVQRTPYRVPLSMQNPTPKLSHFAVSN
jgi:hypothetical protein